MDDFPALMELIAIILWSVQFSSRLTKNVLVVDALQGWTTEGNEKLGYSFWWELKNEKCLFSNTQEFLHNIFITSFK